MLKQKFLPLFFSLLLLCALSACGEKATEEPAADSEMYEQYYQIVADLIDTHGFYVGVDEEYGAYVNWASFGRGFHYGMLHDFEQDGVPELICAYWVDNSDYRTAGESAADMYVQIYRYADGQVQKLLEREVPMGPDVVVGMSFPVGNNPYLWLMENATEGSGEDGSLYTDFYFSIVDGQLVENVLFMESWRIDSDVNPYEYVYDTRFEVNGQAVEKSVYFEHQPTEFGYTIEPIVALNRDMVVSFVEDLGQKAGIDAAAVEALLAPQ